MPSTMPLPTIEELRQAFHSAVRGRRRRADGRDGSSYDYIAGTSAILWSQQAQYTRDLFRAIYVDDADSDDLTDRIQQLWGIDRILDTRGQGWATFGRPAASTAGWFRRGNRVRVGGTYYRVTSDTFALDTQVGALVPIEAVNMGPGVACTNAAGVLDDPVWDPTWTVKGVTCADGTTFESADAYRARARADRRESRVGYVDKVIDACKIAGAQVVAAFPSTFAGAANDYGYSAVYVGDASYVGSTTLVNETILALESVRMMGADLYVGPMTTTPLSITATVALWDDPAAFDLTLLTSALRGAVVREFTGSSSGFSFTLDSLAGVVQSISPAVQSVTFTSPSADATIMTGSPPMFPASLARYLVTEQGITFTYTAPV